MTPGKRDLSMTRKMMIFFNILGEHKGAGEIGERRCFKESKHQK